MYHSHLHRVATEGLRSDDEQILCIGMSRPQPRGHGFAALWSGERWSTVHEDHETIVGRVYRENRERLNELAEGVDLESFYSAEDRLAEATRILIALAEERDRTLFGLLTGASRELEAAFGAPSFITGLSSFAWAASAGVTPEETTAAFKSSVAWMRASMGRLTDEVRPQHIALALRHAVPGWKTEEFAALIAELGEPDIKTTLRLRQFKVPAEAGYRVLRGEIPLEYALNSQ